MDTEEFEILARNLRPRLLSEARSITGNADDAADVVQDAMLKLWTLRDSLGEYRSVEALAVLIVKRMSLNVLRGRRMESLPEGFDSSSSVPSAEDVMIEHQRSEYVDAVLKSLPDPVQTLIRLRHIDGYDNAAIAALLGSSEGAVRTALSRARRKVAASFDINMIQ